MNYKYCTCAKGNAQGNATKQGRTPYRRVEVNSDDTCKECGYYAVSTRKDHDVASGALRKHLMGYNEGTHQQVQKRATTRKATRKAAALRRGYETNAI